METVTAKRTPLDELMRIAKAMSAEKLRLLLLVALKMRTKNTYSPLRTDLLFRGLSVFFFSCFALYDELKF